MKLVTNKYCLSKLNSTDRVDILLDYLPSIPHVLSKGSQNTQPFALCFSKLPLLFLPPFLLCALPFLAFLCSFLPQFRFCFFVVFCFP